MILFFWIFTSNVICNSKNDLNSFYGVEHEGIIKFGQNTLFTGENKVINNFILDNASGQAENLSSTSNIDKSQNISDDDSDEGTLFKNTAQMNQKNY